MSKALGNSLPETLFERLRGRDLESVSDQVIVLCTVDAAGFPHVALLSYFEVVARDRENLRLAVYGDSTTTGNARRDKRLTLILVHARVAYYVKGTVEELAAAMKTTPYNAKLNVRIAQVLADEANPEFEPGAYIAGGLTYVNPGRAAEMERARDVIAELLE